MLKCNETEYTGRPRSDKNARSRKSYREKQTIFYLGRVHRGIKELVPEGNIKILGGNAAPGRARMTGEGCPGLGIPEMQEQFNVEHAERSEMIASSTFQGLSLGEELNVSY